MAAKNKCLSEGNKSSEVGGTTNQPSELNPRKEIQRSVAAVVEQQSVRNRWQAVAVEVADGVGKAVLLISSMVGGIILTVVLAAIVLALA